MRTLLILTALLIFATSLVGCRGWRSQNQPIHPNLNMDFTDNYKAFRPNPFFADNMAMRTPPPGTVARDHLQTDENAPYLLGRDPGGEFVQTMPINVTEVVLARGQERYNIFCAVCHGGVGDGQGVIMAGNQGMGYGYVPAPTFHSDAARAQPDGFYYDALTRGIRTMPGYGHTIPVADRWAIVAHIRALQRAQDAAPGDLPPPEAQRLGVGSPATATE